MGTHTFVSFQFRGILKKSTTNTSMIFLFFNPAPSFDSYEPFFWNFTLYSGTELRISIKMESFHDIL